MNLCNQVDEHGRCTHTARLIANKEHLIDFCILNARGDKRTRTWAHPIESTNLCYYHFKKEEGLFNTKVEDYR